jgi:site-specific DNA-methyltransferase (adenine-specific)
VNLLPAFVGAPEVNRVYHCDALTLTNALAPQSVDMILADLPYGTTACAWDEIIPLAPMWAAFNRVIKPHGAIVLTASQPFTSKLVMSNPKMFRHEWIWEKPKGTGYVNANRVPMKNHESVLVFSDGFVVYFPQMRKGKPYTKRRSADGEFIGDKNLDGYFTINDGERYPVSVIHYDTDKGLHPTQKPVALFDYLIRTYTQEGDLVLDPTCGSGTTAIAARNTGRRFICGDLDAGYVEIARQRLAQPYTPDMFLQAEGA